MFSGAGKAEGKKDHVYSSRDGVLVYQNVHAGKKEPVTRTTERVPKPPLAADFVSSVRCPLNVEDQERVSSYLMGKVDYEYQELQMQGFNPSIEETSSCLAKIHLLMESNDETVTEAMLRLFCVPHKAYGRAVVDEMCLIVAKLFLCLDDEGGPLGMYMQLLRTRLAMKVELVTFPVVMVFSYYMKMMLACFRSFFTDCPALPL